MSMIETEQNAGQLRTTLRVQELAAAIVNHIVVKMASKVKTHPRTFPSLRAAKRRDLDLPRGIEWCDLDEQVHWYTNSVCDRTDLSHEEARQRVGTVLEHCIGDRSVSVQVGACGGGAGCAHEGMGPQSYPFSSFLPLCSTWRVP